MTIWEYLPKRYYFWTIIKQKRQKVNLECDRSWTALDVTGLRTHRNNLFFKEKSAEKGPHFSNLENRSGASLNDFLTYL